MKTSLTALALALGLSLFSVNKAHAVHAAFDLCREVAKAYNAPTAGSYQCTSHAVGLGGFEIEYHCSGGGQTWLLVSTDEGCRGIVTEQ